MTQMSPPRNRWVTREGDKELTYIGREISGVYHVEALVIRTGLTKIVYQFRVPPIAADEPLSYAGRPPEEIINCEFMVTKTAHSANVATLVSAMGNVIGTVDLSTKWYDEL